jgi:hypothetical protein
MSLDRVRRMLGPARSLRLVILDARRDNPIVQTVTRTYKCRWLTKGTFCGQFILDLLQQSEAKNSPAIMPKEELPSCLTRNCAL